MQDAVRRLTRVLLIVALFGVPPVVAAPKTDVLVLKDGSRLIGQVKSLGRGQLSFSTNAAGTILVEWDFVAELVSDQSFRLETNTGALYFGSLVEPTNPDRLRIKDVSGMTDLPLLDVVRITTMASASSNCWSGDVDAGYSLASANHQSQFNFDLHVQCRTPNLLGRLSAYDITTGTSSQPSSQNAAALLEAYHLFPQRWFAGGLFAADRNDQLGIDSRFSVGVGGGRYLVQSSNHVWAVAVGIVESREQDVDSPTPTMSTEALLQTSFDWFRLASPQLDLSTTVSVLPSLTDSGRWRGKATLSLKWEIVSNLFLRLQFMGDFDTKPGDSTETKTDYNVSTSVGYSFNE